MQYIRLLVEIGINLHFIVKFLIYNRAGSLNNTNRCLSGRNEGVKDKIRLSILILIVFLMIGIPFSVLYVLNNGNPYTKYLVEKYVPDYLKQKGYSDSEIKLRQYVEPNYLINQEVYHGHYEVIFIDEPNTTYYYGVTKKEKKVIQFCEKDVISKDGVTDTATEPLKHSEENCLHSLENR